MSTDSNTSIGATPEEMDFHESHEKSYEPKCQVCVQVALAQSKEHAEARTAELRAEFEARTATQPRLVDPGISNESGTPVESVEQGAGQLVSEEELASEETFEPLVGVPTVFENEPVRENRFNPEDGFEFDDEADVEIKLPQYSYITPSPVVGVMFVHQQRKTRIWDDPQKLNAVIALELLVIAILLAALLGTQL